MFNLPKPAVSIFQTAVTEAPLGVYGGPDTGYAPIPASLDPLVIPDELWRSLQNDAHQILSALQKLGAVLRKNPRHRLLQGLAPLEKSDADFGGLATARLDLFFDGDDLVVIEANTTIPAMQAYSDMIKAAWWKSMRPDDKPPSSNTQDLLRSLLDHYERTGGRAVTPRLAIVARPGDSQLAELLWLQREWQAQGYETLLVTPVDLVMRQDQLWAAAQPIDLIYRHIFAHRLDQHSALARALLQSDRYRIFNPIAAHLEAKGVLAELSRYAAAPSLAREISLNEDEIDATQRRVAWTRILEPGPATAADGSRIPDLIPWVKERPAELVIKSSLGYGGQGVFIGSDCADRARKLLGVSEDVSWSRLVDFLLTQGEGQWIVQKKASGRKVRHRFLAGGQVMEKETFVDCSIFTNSGVDFRPGGGACRFSTDSIVNIGQGGGLMPLLLERELR